MATYGRYFLRQGDLFNSIDTIVQHGILKETADSDDEMEMTEKYSHLFFSIG